MGLRKGKSEALCANSCFWVMAAYPGKSPSVHGWGGACLHVRTCTLSPYLRIRLTNCAKIWYVARDPIVTRYKKSDVGWLHIRTCVSSFVVSETTESWHWSHTKKTGLSLSRSLVHRQTWRLTGFTLHLTTLHYITLHCLPSRLVLDSSWPESIPIPIPFNQKRLIPTPDIRIRNRFRFDSIGRGPWHPHP